MVSGNTGDTYYPPHMNIPGVNGKLHMLVRWEDGATEWVEVAAGEPYTFPRPGQVLRFRAVTYSERPAANFTGVFRWQEGGAVAFESYEQIARRKGEG